MVKIGIALTEPPWGTSEDDLTGGSPPNYGLFTERKSGRSHFSDIQEVVSIGRDRNIELARPCVGRQRLPLNVASTHVKYHNGPTACSLLVQYEAKNRAVADNDWQRCYHIAKRVRGCRRTHFEQVREHAVLITPPRFRAN